MLKFNQFRIESRLSLLAGMFLFGWSTFATAVLEIQITEGMEGEIPVAIVPFGSTGEPGSTSSISPRAISDVISSDLARTGRFSQIPEHDFLEQPHHGGEVNFENWRALGIENLVIGQVKSAGKGNYVVQFQLFDIYKKSVGGPIDLDYKIKQIAGYNLPVKADELRQIAHYISDIIYEKLTGQRGAFGTQIAYITSSKLSTSKQGSQTKHALQVADSDGHNPFTILTSKDPIMSPSWSPDAKRLAYVSFEGGKSAIYVQEIESGIRKLISSKKGVNGAPAWSPDGKRLAIARSHRGNTEIHIIDLASRKDRRITHNAAIDTEPAWSPDGRSIVFTSDRSGRPQLYRINLNGGIARRLTFEGNYNSRPGFSPDGKSLVMVHGTGAGFKIAILELETNFLHELTPVGLDESPSFSPNGDMILYATEYRKRGVLAAVSIDGRAHHRLLLQDGDVREPAWAPFSSK